MVPLIVQLWPNYRGMDLFVCNAALLLDRCIIKCSWLPLCNNFCQRPCCALASHEYFWAFRDLHRPSSSIFKESTFYIRMWNVHLAGIRAPSSRKKRNSATARHRNLRISTFSNTWLKCTLARWHKVYVYIKLSFSGPPIPMKEYGLHHGCLITHVNNIPITLLRHSKHAVPLLNRYGLRLF